MMIQTDAKRRGATPERRWQGVTIIELLVILAILSILATVAVGNYSASLNRARIAGALAEIRILEEACERYKLDTGQYPPSSSGTQFAPNPLNPDASGAGCGYMLMSLRASLNGNAFAPLSGHWRGPYIDVDRDQTGTLQGDELTTATVPMPMVQMLDVWGRPYKYIRFDDYATMGGVRTLPNDPYSEYHEFENPFSFQIISAGPDGIMYDLPGTLGEDDLSNFTR